MVVVLIAHSKVERFEDPESAPYDRYSPRLHKHAGALICEWCDAVLFLLLEKRPMANLNGFDASQVEPADDLEPIPAGNYCAVIVESEMKPTKSGTGSYLELKFQIIEGQYTNRLLWTRLNLDNPNDTAVHMARRELSAICRAVGVMAPNGSLWLNFRGQRWLAPRLHPLDVARPKWVLPLAPLTAVAKAITDKHWNGFHFFGLRQPRGAK